MEDKIVKKVIDKFKQRSEAGIKKYGVTLERNDLNFQDWIQARTRGSYGFYFIPRKNKTI
jgi:hypothetical protein